MKRYTHHQNFVAMEEDPEGAFYHVDDADKVIDRLTRERDVMKTLCAQIGVLAKEAARDPLSEKR